MVVGRLALTVPADLEGERLDKTLASLLDLSRAQARTLVDDGVFVDGTLGEPSDRVRQGSRLDTPEPREAMEMRPEPMEFGVLYEDDDLVVVDKPPGVVVHPGSGRRTGTLAAGLLHRYPQLEGVGQADRWGLVHRLDRDTSGTMIIALNEPTYEALSSMIRNREVTRVYTALTHGLFSSPTGMIDAPIGRDPSRPTRRAVMSGGKEARTHYEVVEEFPSMGCSLLRVRLETGRTHQIRVHLEAIDHPIIGDHTYTRRTFALKPPRIFLHASSVDFIHPTTAAALTVESPLPSDLTAMLALVGESSV
jgi:23S rRNA pseudouridine1911/1915/1917 synthase